MQKQFEPRLVLLANRFPVLGHDLRVGLSKHKHGAVGENVFGAVLQLLLQVLLLLVQGEALTVYVIHYQRESECESERERLHSERTHDRPSLQHNQHTADQSY